MQRLLLFVLVALVASGLPAAAQAARSQLNGTVTDRTGGVIVGATVVATALDTQIESKTATTDAGVYVIPYLPAGRYTIHVTSAGFRRAVTETVVLRVGQTLTIDFKREVEALVEQGTVTSP